ncbi:MAG: hypothetical protein ACRDHE_09910, partial [Ktedonobacterales bacterium]
MTSRGPQFQQAPRRRRHTVARRRSPVRSPAGVVTLAGYHAARPVALWCGGYAGRIGRRYVRRERLLLVAGAALALAVLLTVLSTGVRGTPSNLDVLRRLPAYTLVYPGATQLKLSEATSRTLNTALVTVTRVYGMPQATAPNVTTQDIVTWYSSRLQHAGWQSVAEQADGVPEVTTDLATACDHFDLRILESLVNLPSDLAGIDLSSYAQVFF